MTYVLEVVVPLVASNGNRWHEVRRQVEIDPADAPDGRVDLALAVEINGRIATAAKTVQLEGDTAAVELDAITIDPTDNPTSRHWSTRTA